MLSRFRALMITLPMTAFLAFGLSACATESEMEPAAAEVEEAAAPSGDVAADLLTDWNRLKDRMVSQAEAMPAKSGHTNVAVQATSVGEWQSTATRTLSIRSLSLIATLGKCWPTSVEASWSRRTASTWMLTATYG